MKISINKININEKQGKFFVARILWDSLKVIAFCSLCILADGLKDE